KVHFGMPQADIADDTNPGARLRVDHNQGTPDEAPVVWIERQNNLASPGKPEAALYIKDHQSNYPFVIRDHNDTNIFSILGDGRIESYPVDTDLTAGRNYFFMDVNVNTSEAQWTGVDYTKSGIFVDMDASGTGGNTTDELRLYAIRGDCRSTHQTADLVCGVYGYAEAQHSTGTTTNTYGVYGYAVGDDTGTGRSQSVFGGHFLSYAYASGTGGTNTHYAVYGKTLLTTAADKDHTSVYGSRFEIEIDNPGQAQSVTTAYVVAAEFDNDSAGNVSIGTSYLYYGNYAGTLPTNAYGLYILDSVDNYLAGDLDVAGTKNFQIKHPLPSLANTHNLVHTVIEGPSADNMYNGMVRLVNGSATINIDTEFGMTEGTFVALNRNIRRSVTNEEGFTAVKCSLNGNILTITAQDNTCTDEVFWMVIGQRQDQEIKASTKTDANGTDVFNVGIDIFGVSNWVRTLKSIPPWWESFKVALYDEMGDPATDEARHRKISPLFHAENIIKPMLVIQGSNDPRVLQIESDEIVSQVRSNNIYVDYLVFPDEGHGFRKKTNRVNAADSIVDFLDKCLKQSLCS
ncbi:alpha/beta hydrolase family protein, partial [Winogradskyella sp.]|uniref:alpha/beta hydrolase family protein n=1 Tax=Winogradskyella sp. TaxID=1883156 RepID=UPI00351475F6